MFDRTDPACDAYIRILEAELIPVTGCTEPIAIAYGAAKARQALGSLPEKCRVECSGNIIKNVKSVVVPNTGYLRGIEAAAAAGLVAVKRPVTYRYGIVLPEYPADVPAMLEQAKAGATNDGSGYWLDGTCLQAGPLVHESSLMIPLKAYLDALPCGAAWDDGGVSLQKRDGTVLYRIELRETPMRFSLPKDRVRESAALIQRDGTWYLDFWTFQTLLRDLSIGYETVIDTEQGVFQIRLIDRPERYLLSSIDALA